MQVDSRKSQRMFELRPTSPDFKVRGGVVQKGRHLLGRSESCDLMINHDAVSAIHAVLEVFDDKAVVYDMNSTNGTFVNDDKVVVKEIRQGDVLRIADVEFEYLPYEAISALPPVLEALEPQAGEASVKMPPLPEIPKSLPKVAPQVAASAPSIVYPLAQDPKAEFSEYIFEDKQEIFPIFRYETDRQAVEVIILFKDNVFSVDYLPEGSATYFIAGVLSDKDQLEFPYLGKTEKLPFVEVRKGSAIVHTLPGFSVFYLSDSRKDTGHQSVTVELRGQDIVRLQKDDLQIFVRNVSAPPKVAAPPILKRDPEFQKYLALFLFFVGLISIGFNVVEVPEDKSKEELAPERLATILYKQPLTVNKNDSVAKTEKAPKVAQKAPQKPAVENKVPEQKQPDVKTPDVVETKDQTKKPDPGSKSVTVKKVVKQGTEPVTKPTEKIAAPAPAKANNTVPSANSASAFSPTESKAIGHVEVYKSADFKSSVSSLVAKGGSLSGIKTNSVGSGGGSFVGSASGVSTGTGAVKTADIQTNQGSLVGATTGVLGTSKGAEGLSAKRAIYTAGIPSETVVLGSMDPDVIRRILLDHLPQFRFCYQKELERTGTDLSGVIRLDFTIGASGRVSNAGVDSGSNLPREVKGCVVNVLKGITFPEPMGGGVVEVKQPFNFYPKTVR